MVQSTRCFLSVERKHDCHSREKSICLILTDADFYMCNCSGFQPFADGSLQDWETIVSHQCIYIQTFFNSCCFFPSSNSSLKALISQKLLSKLHWVGNKNHKIDISRQYKLKLGTKLSEILDECVMEGFHHGNLNKWVAPRNFISCSECFCGFDNLFSSIIRLAGTFQKIV